jgi:hypothetical protein
LQHWLAFKRTAGSLTVQPATASAGTELTAHQVVENKRKKEINKIYF